MVRVVAPGRVEIEGAVSDGELRALARDPGLTTLMLSRPPESGTWPRLNEACSSIAPMCSSGSTGITESAPATSASYRR